MASRPSRFGPASPTREPGRAHLGVARLAIAAITGAVIGGRLCDVGLPGGLLDPFARAPRVLLAHCNREIGVAAKRDG
jgi:hypothetical protein